MSLLRITARRSLNAALSNTAPAVARVPLLARSLASNAAQKDDELIKHAPGWKHENASESEASVKADREPHSRDVSHMQDETVKHLKRGEEDFVDNLKAKASDTAEEYVNKAKSVGSQVSNYGGEYVDKASQAGQHAKEEYGDKAKKAGQEAKEEVGDKTQAMGSKMSDQAKKVGEEAKSMGSKASEYGGEYVDQAKKAGEKYLKGEDIGGRAKSEATHAQGMVKDGAQKVSDFVKSTVDSAKKAVGMDSNSSSSSSSNNNNSKL
ncbi:hypothetical protein BG015_010834 [Linnemannia schmuckeri]|uniref:Uncharacterized protein n=1 Tax=Linnemannia schmuckeri TaxID=64567 RepID=A0A9P5S9Y0_9FUNG|nr:hypothetical protein BG015_010834 [Linnemannia schmuckeri]